VSWIIGYFAKSALMTSPLGGLLKRFWKPLAIVAAAVALFLLHQHFVHKFRDKVVNDVNKAWQTKLDAEHAAAVAWKHKYDLSNAAMAQEIRKRHEETLRSDAVLANDLRVRGPGAARCGQGDHPITTAGAGGRDAGRGQAGAAVAAVPDQERVDLIGLPFTGTINAGQQCDGNRSEVISWREFYRKLVATWPK
jgi:hypothetical protein